MVATEHGFRNRATSLLQAASIFRRTLHSTADSGTGDRNTPSPNPLHEKPRKPSDQSQHANTSESSNEKTAVPPSQEVAAETRDSQRAVRTIPTWVRSPSPASDSDDDDDDDADAPPNQSLLHPLPSSHPAQHNHTPTSPPHRTAPTTHITHPFGGSPAPGRLYDAEREWTSPIPNHHLSTFASRWAAFAAASAYPHPSSPTAERVSPEWLLENGPDYSQPWRAHATPDLDQDGQKKRRRKAFLSRAQRMVLRNPIVPLVIRSTVWCLSLAALALGATVYRQCHTEESSESSESSKSSESFKPTSPEMAVVVDAIALLYLIYITYDEYTGKPLGLRSAKSKMRLIFLDLFFIVFDSANLSLAYAALPDPKPDAKPDAKPSCAAHREQVALAWVLLMALVAWLLTFSISVMRLVDRTTQK